MTSWSTAEMTWHLDLLSKYNMKEKYNSRERGPVLEEKTR